MPNLKELREEIKAKSQVLHGIFEEAGPDLDMSKVKSLEGDSKAKTEKIKGLNDELSALGIKVDELKSIDDARNQAERMYKDTHVVSLPQPEPKASGEPEYKTIGTRIMEAKNEWFDQKRDVKVPFDMKTDFTTSAGWAPESLRLPGAVMSPARPIAVVDFIPQYPTSQAAIVYMLETTATFSAAEKAEAAAYAESTFALTATTRTVEKVTTSLPVTDEQLDDVPAAAQYIDQRLTYDLKRRLDLQVLEGDGSTPNILGTLSIGGSLQTQALGTDPVPDAIYKAFDLVRTVGFTEPSVLFINPSDWQPVRLLRTADGIYIWGSPTEAGPERIWGKTVLQTTAVTANTAITGDYTMFSGLYVRKGITISTGYVNDDFAKGLRTIRAEIRCAMVHFRTAAFCTVTGI